MSQQDANDHALEFCSLRPKWQRFCDIPDTDALMITWEELPIAVRRHWEDRYFDAAKTLWNEYATSKPMRHRYGFVDEQGEFHDTILTVKGNFMMVIETRGPEGMYRRGGPREKSARTRKAARLTNDI